jgi:TPR repeat protein
MYKCLFCGLVNPSEKARFCVECGPDGAAKDWTQEDIDQPQKVTQYVSLLSEFYFNAHTEASVEKYSLRARERLKISHDTHAGVMAKLGAQKKEIAHLVNFRLEFNENVTDAYAGHDTFLGFRYTNLSEDDLLKISLVWDDPETTDRIDLRAQSSSYVKPQGTVTLGASVIFDRIGIKELADMQITIADQFGETATFRAEPFSFKVGNHDQRITQNVSNHNQISIEGRGVVDASGMGAQKSVTQPSDSTAPRWRDLSFSYIPKTINAQNSAIPESKLSPETTQQKVEKLDSLKTNDLSNNKDDLFSVLAAAEQGNADAQVALGQMYVHGRGLVKDEVKGVQWYRKAAEQGNAHGLELFGDAYRDGIGVEANYELALHWYRKGIEQEHPGIQVSLGTMYQYGLGVAQSDEQALQWYRKAADQGNAYAQNCLGNAYYGGTGVIQNHEQAVHWYQKAADQGNADAQNNLGNVYHHGTGVVQDHVQAVHWYQKAADLGNADAQNNLGNVYYHGTGVVQDHVQAAHWWKMATDQGSTQAGTFVDGIYQEPNSLGEPDYVYLGASSNGIPNGVGKMTWNNGDVYKGDFVNGVRHGLGELTYANGTQLNGRFENNEFVKNASFADNLKIGYKIGKIERL